MSEYNDSPWEFWWIQRSKEIRSLGDGVACEGIKNIRENELER